MSKSSRRKPPARAGMRSKNRCHWVRHRCSFCLLHTWTARLRVRESVAIQGCQALPREDLFACLTQSDAAMEPSVAASTALIIDAGCKVVLGKECETRDGRRSF